MKFKLLLSACFALGLAFGLAACGDDSQTQTDTAPESADTLRMAVLALPVTMGNPYSSLNAPTIYTWSAIFDGLTFVRQDGTLEPWLATSWKATSPTTWEFKLRDDVFFSNGEHFTADAVLNAVEYIKTPEAVTGSVAQMLNSIAGARVINDYTVEITTKTPNVMFPNEAASLRIVAPDHWRKLGPVAFARDPHGTGPYRTVSWEPAVVRMEAFEGSWRKPHFKKLEVYAVPDANQRVQGVISGRLDVILGSVPDAMERLEAEGHQWIQIPGGGIILFSFILNPDHPAFGPANEPLMDVRVRRALNYAVNREAYIEALLNNTTRAPSQPATDGVFGYDPTLEPYPYDPEQAKALLAEAGYEDGFDLVIEVVTGTPIPNGEAIFQQVAEDIRAIGVRVELKTFAMAQYFNAIHTGDFKGQGFMMDFPVAPQMDALRGLRLHSCLWKSPWLCNADEQEMINAAMTAPDMEQRLALTQEIMRRYHEQAYMLYLFERVEYYGMRAGLEGFSSDGLFIRYENILKTEKRLN
jgi:peptide/nickel transport system substrate-binding protein